MAFLRLPSLSALRIRPRTLLAGLLFALLAASGALSIAERPWIAEMEARTLDWRFQLRGPRPVPPDIAILAIDDRAIALSGRWPLPRRDLAAALDWLSEAGASVVAADLLLSEPQEGDAALARAIARHGRVVLSLALLFGPSAVPDPGETVKPEGLDTHAFRLVELPAGRRPSGLPQAGDLLLPAPRLAEAAASLAHVNVILDEDGALRHLNPALPWGEDFLPALPLAAARLHLGLPPSALVLFVERGFSLGGRDFPTDRRLTLPLDFYGPRGSFPTFSFADLVSGRLSASDVSGKVVLIGATASGAGDSFATPFSRQLPGVEVFATAVGNLFEGRALERSPRTLALDVLGVFLAVLCTLWLASRGSPLVAALAIAAVALLWLLLAQLAFVQGLWLQVAFPLLAVLLAGTLANLRRFAHERRARREGERQRGNLAQYLPPGLVEILAKERRPSFDERRQPAAVMFVDMRGFTGISERLGPERTVALLRELHRRIERAVHANQGTLEKFMGDGAMILFGLPEARLTDPLDALACARALMSEIAAWRRELQAGEGPPVRLGIGINYGPVVIARLGGERQLQLTATGDTVNVASRLESLTREAGGGIAVSGALVAAVKAAGRSELLEGFEPLPPQALRGREEKLEVWLWREPPEG